MTTDELKAMTPGWDQIAKWGAWTFLVFYLLGAIPGLPPPSDKTAAKIDALDLKLSNTQDAILKAVRGSCYRMKGATADPRTNCE